MDNAMPDMPGTSGVRTLWTKMEKKFGTAGAVIMAGVAGFLGVKLFGGAVLGAIDTLFLIFAHGTALALLAGGIVLAAWTLWELRTVLWYRYMAMIRGVTKYLVKS